MKKKVLEKKIKQAATEYIKRMFNAYSHGLFSGYYEDDHIDCPGCSRRRIFWQGDDTGWQCGLSTCSFSIPKEFVLPKPQELLFLFLLKRKYPEEIEDRVRKFLEQKEINEFLKSK